MSFLHVEIGAFLDRIYVGRLNKAGDRWRAGKQDITAEACRAVAELAKRRGGSTTVQGYRQELIEITVKTIAVGEQP